MICNLDNPDELVSYHHTDKWIQAMLIALGQYFSLHNFVETGTCAGNTVAAVQPYFRWTYSIELNDEYYKNAMNRFSGVKNLWLFNGSSGEILGDILEGEFIEKALFWLDAHGEGLPTEEGDQLYKELKAIEAYAPTSLVVIDDVIKKNGKYEVNFCYPFTTPAGWTELYIPNMSLLILHQGGYVMPEALKRYQ
jgi:hypothetical protein